MKNKYIINNNICYMKTCKTNVEFIFDAEYINKVIQYTWRIDYKNNPFTIINNKKITLKKFLFGDNIYIHVDGNNLNITKENIKHLRGYKNNGRSILNGYICIYMPEHKKAFSNGCVYEHIIEAENMLGRELYDEEVVHHIDRNRKNKCPLCGNLKATSSKLCYECNLKNRNSNIPSKNELESLIYNNTFTQIGNIYGVSDNAVRKWCVKYNLPYRMTDVQKYIIQTTILN